MSVYRFYFISMPGKRTKRCLCTFARCQESVETGGHTLKQFKDHLDKLDAILNSLCPDRNDKTHQDAVKAAVAANLKTYRVHSSHFADGDKVKAPGGRLKLKKTARPLPFPQVLRNKTNLANRAASNQPHGTSVSQATGSGNIGVGTTSFTRPSEAANQRRPLGPLDSNSMIDVSATRMYLSAGSRSNVIRRRENSGAGISISKHRQPATAQTATAQTPAARPATRMTAATAASARRISTTPQQPAPSIAATPMASGRPMRPPAATPSPRTDISAHIPPMLDRMQAQISRQEAIIENRDAYLAVLEDKIKELEKQMNKRRKRGRKLRKLARQKKSLHLRQGKP